MSAPAAAPAAATSSGSKRTLASDSDSEQRRVQPRRDHDHDHDHDRARSQGGPQLTASSAAHADAPPHRAPAAAAAVTLHRHALESIFAFLGRRKLTFALRVSKGWMAAVGSMRRLDLSAGPLSSSQRLGRLVQSAMGRHVAELRHVTLNAETLSVLAARMGHLRHLHCELSLRPGGQPLVAFPASLRQLHVELQLPTGEAQITAVILAIAQLPLLDELTLSLPVIGPQTSLAPLAALPLLRRLDFCWPRSADELSDAQVDQLRSLPRLQKVTLPMTAPLLRRLLRQPHDLQWRQIYLPGRLDTEAAALLPLLPSLTAVVYGWVVCERFGWLAQLPNLTTVDLRFYVPNAAAGFTESLAAGLRHCARVEILKLSNCADLSADQLAELLPRLPRLRELTLDNLRVDSLAFLAQPPLTGQLRLLQLRFCKRLPLLDLRHVQGLRGLRQLELRQSFSAPLDEFCESLFRPPSVLLPLLETFDYAPPEDDGPESQGDDDGSDGSDGDDGEKEESEEEQ